MPSNSLSYISWWKYGYLDIYKLILKKKIKIDYTVPVSLDFIKVNSFPYQCGISAIIGQIKDGKPCGFVRAYYYSGTELSIYEGFMDVFARRNGFGRCIGGSGNQDIGWFMNNNLHGNGQFILVDG